MTAVPTHAFADRARAHLGDPGPLNTCWSNGPELWADELDLPGLDTASVTEAERRARAGTNGWRYVEGTSGLARGHIGDWKSEALQSSGARHVSVVDDVEGSTWRGIGSGTPSGTVARQPASGGFNPKSVLRGYFIPPTLAKSIAKPASASDGDVYTVKRGDYLAKIARDHRTSVAAILRANPARPDRRSADFRIARANLIVVGQRIRLP